MVAASPVICAGPQRLLQGAALLRQVAGPVGRDPVGQVSRARLGQLPPRRLRHRLRPAPGSHERQCRHLLRTSSASSWAASAVAARRTGAPASPRAPVSGGSHSANVSGARGAPSVLTACTGRPVSSVAAAGGLADRGRRQHEHRARRAVVIGNPAQPAQHVRDMGAEDAAVGMALVDDDVAQPPEEAVPPGVAGQQRLMQHVGRRQQVVGVRPGPGPLGPGRVAVDHRGADAVQRQATAQLELICRQRPGRARRTARCRRPGCRSAPGAGSRGTCPMPCRWR